MSTFHFRVDQPNQAPVIKTRDLADDSQALAYARQLLLDWPDCAMIDVLQGETLIDRVKPQPA